MKRIILLMLIMAVPLLSQTLTSANDLHSTTDDFALEIARGKVVGMTKVNKFGYAPSGVQSTVTDIWDLADASPTQSVWLPPSTADSIKIVSSVNQDSAGLVGANTIRIYGLQTWDSAESYEDISLNGTDSATATNTYVIIHRMRVLTSGSSDSVNIGNIRAVAKTGPVVTAQISAGLGQTEMAVYGVPSTQTAYITHWYGDLMKASGGAAHVQLHLKVNQNPDTDLKDFVTKSIRGIQSTGNNWGGWYNVPYMSFAGPCIIKVSGYGSANDLDTSAGFDLILVTN